MVSYLEKQKKYRDWHDKAGEVLLQQQIHRDECKELIDEIDRLLLVDELLAAGPVRPPDTQLECVDNDGNPIPIPEPKVFQFTQPSAEELEDEEYNIMVATSWMGEGWYCD